MPDPSQPLGAVPLMSDNQKFFAAHRYLGYVQFLRVNAEIGATRVVWSVKWTPSPIAYLILDGWLLVWSLRSAMRANIAKLQSDDR